MKSMATQGEVLLALESRIVQSFMLTSDLIDAANPALFHICHLPLLVPPITPSNASPPPFLALGHYLQPLLFFPISHLDPSTF